MSADCETGATYALSNRSKQEERRLALLEGILDPLTFTRLSSIPVSSDPVCLEVGAGRGSVARWLAQMAGPQGHVVATDIDTFLLETIADPAIEVWSHDVRVDELPTGRFDLVHTRALLAHLPERDEVIDRLVATLRPGGWLVVEDLDYCTIGATGPEEYRRGMDAMAAELRTQSGTSYEWPRHLGTQFAAVGLEDIRVDGHLLFFPGASPVAELMELSWRDILGEPDDEPGGGIDPDVYRQAHAALRDPRLWMPFPAVIGAVGRVLPSAR